MVENEHKSDPICSNCEEPFADASDEPDARGDVLCARCSGQKY